MDFSTDFYRDEVRYGFYIPTAIKQAWAAELMVLGEIDRICRKYNIKYYAEWGTLLGAVRHGGFVPWDDDMDIGMLREDYIRFRKVAPRESGGCLCICFRDNNLFVGKTACCSCIQLQPSNRSRASPP